MYSYAWELMDAGLMVVIYMAFSLLFKSITYRNLNGK